MVYALGSTIIKLLERKHVVVVGSCAPPGVAERFAHLLCVATTKSAAIQRAQSGSQGSA